MPCERIERKAKQTARQKQRKRKEMDNQEPRGLGKKSIREEAERQQASEVGKERKAYWKESKKKGC